MGINVFPTGAKRSDDLKGLRYDLIPQIGLRRLAATCAEGAAKYGDHNWLKGMPIDDMLNHALSHISHYLCGDRSEDHLAHAAWNLFAAMHSEDKWQELNLGRLCVGYCDPPVSVPAGDDSSERGE